MATSMVYHAHLYVPENLLEPHPLISHWLCVLKYSLLVTYLTFPLADPIVYST